MTSSPTQGSTAWKSEDFAQRVVDSFEDSDLFAQHFQPAESWRAWLTVLRCLFGLPLSADDLALFQRCTGRTQAFTSALIEAWLLCGRRSGKSRFLALIAVCLACFRDYAPFLAPGEQALVMVLAKDRDQAGVIFGYARALITQTPLLASMLEHETADTLKLRNGVVIGVFTSSYKSVRGRTLACCLADEVAFWEGNDSRNPAAAILRALRPSLSTIPGAMLLCASSTYTMEGALFESFHTHHGKDTSPVMVWKADTQTMNPSFRQEVIDAAYAADAQDAAAEYGSEWLTDARAHFPDAVIDAAIVPDRQSIVRDPYAEYSCFVDMSGGVSDASVLAIAHQDADRRVVLDRLEAVKPPFKPEDVCQRFADILSGYGLSEITGDGYAAQWMVDAFRRVGVHYMRSELTKSEIYIQVQPLFTGRRVDLLDLPALAGELRRLERRPRAGGRDQVDHPRGSHDDQANAACGAIWMASKRAWASQVAEQASSRHVSAGYNPLDRYVQELEREESATYRGPYVNRH